MPFAAMLMANKALQSHLAVTGNAFCYLGYAHLYTEVKGHKL